MTAAIKKTKMNNKKNVRKIILFLAFFCWDIFIIKNVANGANCEFLVGEEKDNCIAERCEQYTQNPESLNDECAQITDEKDQKKCAEYNKTIVATCKLINLKQKQVTSIGNQLSLMQSEISSLENEISQNQNKIGQMSEQMAALLGKIKEKEELINKQKKVLVKLIQVYYENSRKNLFAYLGGVVPVYAFLSDEDHIAEISQKAGEVLSNIQGLKIELEKEHNELEKNKNETIELKNQLEEKTQTLETSKKQKKILLIETRGEEEKYKKKLERVEQQKQDLLGDIDELYVANSAEIDALVEKAPSKYWAKNNWYYSQKDTRWGNKTIGQSKSLLKDYGCALSSVAMVFTYYGETVTPAIMAKQPIYYWDLISWPAKWSGISLIANTKHSGVNWSTIDKEIEKEHPVIIFVKAKGRAGHYVVIHTKTNDGKYVVHDPYFGANIYLDSTMKALGKMYGTSISKSKIDQMIVYEK